MLHQPYNMVDERDEARPAEGYHGVVNIQVCGNTDYDTDISVSGS